MPHPSVLEKDGVTSTWLWQNSILFRSRRNPTEAKQLHTKMMVVPEKVGETELPSTLSTPIHGPVKYSQIGSDAASKLLSAAVEPLRGIFHHKLLKLFFLYILILFFLFYMFWVWVSMFC